MTRRVAILALTVLATAAGLAAGGTLTVPAGGSLQSALNNAQPGDTILLAAGATYTGNFVLPPKNGTAFITIRSSAADSMLPPAGTRITPAFASALPKLQSANGSMPALSTATAASYYVIQFVEFLQNPNGAGAMIELGSATSAQSTLASVPHDLVIDRCYLHSVPGVAQLRGIALNSGKTTIRDSYISEIKYAGQDSQAIAGWNGPGPYTILNNYLEAAGENFLLGGSSMLIPNTTPTGITFRNNYCTKQAAWRGSSWTVKNIFELKHAQDVTVDGNVFENNWLAAQSGYSIVFTPRNQYNDNPWTVVQRVSFTNNIVRHVSSVFNILGYDNNAPSLQTNHIAIRNNVMEDVNGTTWGGLGRLMLINQTPDVTVDHNTGFNSGSAVYVYGGLSARFVFTNNIVSAAVYGIIGDSAAEGNGTISTYFSDGSFQENLLVGTTKTSFYPGMSFFPASMSAVGFVDLSGGDYHLASTSAYKGKATDGTDPGANIDTLKTAQAGGSTWTSTGAGTGGGAGTGAGPSSSVPSPWTNGDVGAVGLAGSASYANGTFTQSGAGADIWGTSDGFNFTYRPLNGDGQIVARVVSTQNTNAYAKAGVMIRESLAAGSSHALLDVKPGGGIEWLTRTATGVATNSAGTAGAAPVWLKLGRAGSTFTASTSVDGTTWTKVGDATISMLANVYVGLAVCSHTTGALNASTFDNVTAGPATTTPSTTAAEIVIYATDVPGASIHGWSLAADSTAAAGSKAATADVGWATTSAPLAQPTQYMDVTFSAVAGQPYTLWLRLQGTANSKYNESVWVQFSDALANGASVYPLNTTSGLLVNLENCSGCGVSGWGWQNTAYWLSQATTVTFASTGTHTMRIQVREDGVQLDQVVLSPVKYRTSAPGALKNDATIVSK